MAARFLRRGISTLTWALVVGSAALAGCLPDPQSVAERRASFPREALRSESGFFSRIVESVGLASPRPVLILDALPEDAQRIDAEFGRLARLVGYRLSPQRPSPGDRLEITFYWSAIREIPEDYQVFIHGDAIGGQAPRLHGDHFPALGRYPTDVWQVGEIVVDPFTVWVPPGYGAPQLGIQTGLYKGDYRVPLTAPGRVPSGTDDRSQAVTISFR